MLEKTELLQYISTRLIIQKAFKIPVLLISFMEYLLYFFGFVFDSTESEDVTHQCLSVRVWTVRAGRKIAESATRLAPARYTEGGRGGLHLDRAQRTVLEVCSFI